MDGQRAPAIAQESDGTSPNRVVIQGRGKWDQARSDGCRTEGVNQSGAGSTGQRPKEVGGGSDRCL